MDELERIKFLKKMGYGGSALRSYMDRNKPEAEIKKQTSSNYVDKQDLLAIHKIFNTPKAPEPDAEIKL
jgi:hypothetical protein